MEKPVETVGKDLSLHEKIILIMNELRATKDGRNDFAKYNYFQPDTLLSLLNPLLKQYGILTKFNLLYKETHYSAELTLMDKKEKEVYTFDILKATVKGANEAQNSGATLTYAKRYSLMNAFNIAENNDDFDSNAQSSQKAVVGNPKRVNEVKTNIEDYSDFQKLKSNGMGIVEECVKAGCNGGEVLEIQKAINDKLARLKNA